MASNVVPCQLTNAKKVNFARLSRLVIDLFARILRDILVFHYPRPEDLQQRIRDKHLEERFRKYMNKILDGDRYEKCDVTILYNLIRHTCHITPPTVTRKRKMAWGGDRMPSKDCITLGDDIERMNIIRNEVWGHASSTEIEDNLLEKYFDISEGVCRRLIGHYGIKNYVKELETIRNCRMEEDSVHERVMENRDIMCRNFDKVYEKLTQLSEKDCPLKTETFFQRDINGNISALTTSALDLINRLQTEAENLDVVNKSRQLINEVIIDLCGSRGGLNLQLLETHFRHLFSSSFKKTTDLKLIEYLRKNTNIFAMYQPNGKQWKVMLVEHHRSNLVKRKKHKITKSQKTISRGKIKVEEFDIESVYPKTSVITEDMKCQTPSTYSVLLKPESCKHSSKVIQNAEATRVNNDGDDEDDEDDDDDDQIVEKIDKQETINQHGQKIIDPLKAASSPSRIEIHTSSNLTKQAIYKSSAYRNNRGYIEEMVTKSACSSAVESISKDKNTQLLQNATNKHTSVSLTEMNKREFNISHLPSPDSVAQSMHEFMEKVHSFEKSFGSFALVVGKADIVPNIEYHGYVSLILTCLAEKTD